MGEEFECERKISCNWFFMDFFARLCVRCAMISENSLSDAFYCDKIKSIVRFIGPEIKLKWHSMTIFLSIIDGSMNFNAEKSFQVFIPSLVLRQSLAYHFSYEKDKGQCCWCFENHCVVITFIFHAKLQAAGNKIDAI